MIETVETFENSCENDLIGKQQADQSYMGHMLLAIYNDLVWLEDDNWDPSFHTSISQTDWNV